MNVPDEVETELKSAFSRADLGSSNLSTVDLAAHACIRRVLSRRGLGAYSYAFVWPVVTVDVLPGTPGARRFVFDVRELTVHA
jgi:hypothetical protein